MDNSFNVSSNHNGENPIFREKTTSEPTSGEITPVAAKSDSQEAVVNDIEVPYLDYKNVHGHPLTVDYFELGDKWNEVFAGEVGTLEAYFNGKIHEGVLANDVQTIKKEIKEMEKILDIRSEIRPALRIGILAAHAKFLMETDNLKSSMRRVNGS